MKLIEVITAYQTDRISSFHRLRPRVRDNHVNLHRRLAALDADLAVVNAKMILGWHLDWMGPHKHIAMAHSLIGQLRTVINFGADFLEDADCVRLSGVLHRLRFENPKPRTDILTSAQVAAIRAKAHEWGLHSIAMANAFQGDLALRQKDVIGERLAKQHATPTSIEYGREIWDYGLRWEEIDQDFVLRHVTSKRQKLIVVDLNMASMVMEELRCSISAEVGETLNRADFPSYGPIIIYEGTAQPYHDYIFRSRWRQIATSAGIPKNVRNMDSRAGAITEALLAGAPLDSVRKFATHSDASMTAKYSRCDEAARADVMKARAKNKAEPTQSD